MTFYNSATKIPGSHRFLNPKFKTFSRHVSLTIIYFSRWLINIRDLKKCKHAWCAANVHMYRWDWIRFDQTKKKNSPMKCVLKLWKKLQDFYCFSRIQDSLQTLLDKTLIKTRLYSCLKASWNSKPLTNLNACCGISVTGTLKIETCSTIIYHHKVFIVVFYSFMTKASIHQLPPLSSTRTI